MRVHLSVCVCVGRSHVPVTGPSVPSMCVLYQIHTHTRMSMMMIAFITTSSLVLLIEDRCSSELTSI